MTVLADDGEGVDRPDGHPTAASVPCAAEAQEGAVFHCPFTAFLCPLTAFLCPLIAFLCPLTVLSLPLTAFLCPLTAFHWSWPRHTGHC